MKKSHNSYYAVYFKARDDKKYFHFIYLKKFVLLNIFKEFYYWLPALYFLTLGNVPKQTAWVQCRLSRIMTNIKLSSILNDKQRQFVKWDPNEFSLLLLFFLSFFLVSILLLFPFFPYNLLTFISSTLFFPSLVFQNFAPNSECPWFSIGLLRPPIESAIDGEVSCLYYVSIQGRATTLIDLHSYFPKELDYLCCLQLGSYLETLPSPFSPSRSLRI